MAAKPIYGVGLDAGSRRTRLAICALEESGLRFLGYGAAESAGWLKGTIADQSAVSESILAALRQANDAIAYGTWKQRWINSDVYIYERQFYNDVVLVAINKTSSALAAWS